MRGPQVRFCERCGGATCRAYSTRSSTAPNAGDPPPPSPEVRPRAQRRRFTAAYKQKILAAADAATTPGAIGALLRREGLYSSNLTHWRQERAAAITQGLTPKPRGPKSQQDPSAKAIQQLHREIERLTERLRKAELIIDVQKNYRARLIRTPAGPETPV